ncbi:hypothetical protein [Paracoccus aestuariivivens]|uniref:Uncharacterized protein n=1 Tax=Paracoccus aestuariivivens TaxID=1820333 RepID=A0A6L6JAQ6_9RHOB|nr:hypothetical protein [Paracoccus aestuariivivens]MTH79192.1 hypothetical protein [Paracoccus aestuariivivens]
MQNPKDDEQHLPNHPAQERTTYPSGMERERRMPTGGKAKPKPSPDHRPEKEEERNTK